MNNFPVAFRYLFPLLIMLIAATSLPAGHAVFNIENFGAASGGGDDLAAFTAAFAAAHAGDTVQIPAGSYQISNAIQPKAGVILSGAGRDLSTVQYIGTVSNSMVNLLIGGGPNAQNDVELTGFTLDGMNNINAGQGIAASGTAGHIIHNLRIQNLVDSGFGPHGIYYAGNVDNTRIENNEFFNIGVGESFGSGIRLENGSENNLIANNTIQNTGRGGIFLVGSTDNVIRGNTITGSGLSGGGSGEGLGIEVWGGSDRTIVEDNNIDHWLSVDKSSFVAVRRNTVIATDGTVKHAGIELAGGSDIVITNNTIGLGNRTGLSVTNNTVKERVYIANNSFSDSEELGAQILDNAGTTRQFYLYNNTFSGAQDEGFRLNAIPGGAGIRQFVFDSNKIIDNNAVGLRLVGVNAAGGGGIDEISFENSNMINDNGTLGIQDGNLLESKNLEWDGSNGVSGNGSNNGGLTSNGFANGKPTASITTDDADLMVDLGQAINFGFLYSDDGSSMPAEVLWDFDEGLPVVGFTPTYTFTEVGVYTVALLAWDVQGRAAYDTVQVQVGVAGDFDSDNDVDGFDFLAWQRDSSVGSLADWESNFGTGSGALAASVASVPEPNAAILFCMGVALFLHLSPVCREWSPCGDIKSRRSRQ